MDMGWVNPRGCRLTIPRVRYSRLELRVRVKVAIGLGLGLGLRTCMLLGVPIAVNGFWTQMGLGLESRRPWE